MYFRSKLDFALLTLAIVASSSAASVSSSGSSRIVGGQAANAVNMPFIASLVTYGYHICAGSIINERTVLTAAHCLPNVQAHRLKVHVGTKQRALNQGELLDVLELHYHEQWSIDTMDYDIGVVRLAQPLSYSKTIRPVSLPKQRYVVRDGTLATVAGWGFTSIDGPESEVLRYARVPIINQRTCSRQLPDSITDRMICAGYTAGGIDACQMDSGGPLIAQQKLIGIISWGIGCALPNKPGVYTRITALLPWLEELMQREYSETL